MSFKNVDIVSIKGNYYRIHFWYMSKNDAIDLITNSNLNDKNGILEKSFSPYINNLLSIKHRSDCKQSKGLL